MNNKDKRVGFPVSGRFLDHITGEGHPERPARITGIQEALQKQNLDSRLVDLSFGPCDRESILAVHTEDYLALAQREIETGNRVLSTGDTNVCRDSWEIALLAAGAAVAAVDAVCRRELDYVFCAARPPGHHASQARGMGFCVLNNIAIAARRIQREHGMERVLIVDWDVHHGNGTQDVFYDDPSVLFFSSHEWPLYPGTGDVGETGSGAATGTTINAPLPRGSGRAEVFEAFEEKLMPAVAKFKPDFVLVSAGFDSRIGDPLGGFELTDQDFFDLTKFLMRVADDYAEGRLVTLLEGGYSISGLASAAAAHVRALLGDYS